MPEHHWAFGGRRFRPWHQGDVAFNPFVANLFSQGGGLLPLIVLHLLQEKPRYGNELMTLISQKTGDQLTANPGAVYPLMTELENRGMVEGAWDDPRKRTVRIYHLTAKGEREVNRVKAIVTPKLEEAIEVLQKLVNELNPSKSRTNTRREYDMSEKVIHEVKIIETEDGFRIEMTGDKEELRKLLFEQGQPFSMPFGRGRGFAARGFGGHGPFGRHHHEHEPREHGHHEHGPFGRHHDEHGPHMRPPFEGQEQPSPEEMHNQHFFFRRFGGGRGGWKAKRGTGYDLGPWWDESSTPDDAPPVQL